ncbi:MAG: mismatch-specific DNA-glycosylase [Pseudomonadales bacterium]|nr:mismatch-specific DNA-glycosylase [Pseudomonadales bacterium]
MKTLPDLLAPNLRILSVGINPSLRAVQEAFYFPNPRNRFWPALNASGLLAEPLLPSPAAMQILLTQYRIGFTDLVKKPSSMATALRAADYREAAPLLKQRVLELEPAIVWFHGKLVLNNYLKYTDANQADKQPTRWGLQAVGIGTSQLYVSPNPSPANAQFSLQYLTESYHQLSLLNKEI